ncbi:hypothetical protein [Rhizobium binxianense]
MIYPVTGARSGDDSLPLITLGRLPGFSAVSDPLANRHRFPAWECSYAGGGFRLARNLDIDEWRLAPHGNQLGVIDDVVTLLRTDPSYEIQVGQVTIDRPNFDEALPTRARAHPAIAEWTLLIVSLLLYALCLAQPAYRSGVAGRLEVTPGWLALLTGWMAVTSGMIAWLANPLLLASWVLVAFQRRAALFTAAAAMLLALSFLLHEQIMVDEAGNYGPLGHDGAGYWCWLASIGLTLCAAAISYARGAFRKMLQ